MRSEEIFTYTLKEIMSRKLKKVTGVLAAIIVVMVAAYFIRVAMVQPVVHHPLFDQQGVLVLAHRGGRGLWPENTLYAFRHAGDMGVDVLDMDVHYLKDGHFAVIHDDVLQHTTNGNGKVTDFSLADLQKLDAGYKWTADNGNSFPYRGKGIVIPSLGEVFKEFAGYRMNIEIKQSRQGIPEKLCNLIRQYKMGERVVIASFSDDVMQQFRRACPGVATAAATGEARLFVILNMLHLGRLYHPQTETMQMPGYLGDHVLVDRRFVNTAHAHGMEVYAWTIDDPAQMKLMIASGVDGIITDYPDRLLKLLGRDLQVKSKE